MKLNSVDHWVRIFGIFCTSIIFIFGLGAWVKNLDDRQVYAETEIRSLQDESQKLQDAFHEINQRLSRIEGKLDFTIGRIR